MTRNRGASAERGQSLAEFSIAALVFFVMVLGMIEVGRAVWQYNALAQATREGTRYAIVHGSRSADPAGPGDDGDIVAKVEQFGGGLDLGELSVSATWPDGSNDPGDNVTVESSYTFNPIFGMFGIVSFDMSSSSTMEIRY